MKWRLDGWDRTGGRAFASLRPKDVELLERDESWGPMVYIGPPSFRPESIASSSVALAAARAASFSPRTPEDPDLPEAGFPNADAVAEFVRRAFVAGNTRGGGDGEAVTGGATGPLDPPAGGDGAGRLWRETVEPYLHAARYLAADEKEDARPVYPAHADPVNRYDWPAVEAGALQLIVLLAHQFPGADDIRRFTAWRASARALYRAIQELGLWEHWKQGGDIFDLGVPWRLESAANTLFRGMPATDGEFEKIGSFDPVWFAATWLSRYPAYRRGATAIGSKYLSRLRREATTTSHVYLVTDDAGLDDRHDAMRLWPVPAYAGLPREIENVGQLVMAFVSTPGAFEQVHPRVIDLVAFAAALFASGIEDRGLPHWRERAAQAWLASSMPRWAFRAEVENEILATPALGLAHA